MSNPQQPELARSRKTPRQDQDSVAGVVEGQRRLDTKGPSGPVPPENQPGNHPAEEQDKPELDAFAERLGIVPGEGDGGGSRASAGTADTRSSTGNLLAGVQGRGGFARVAAVLVAVVTLVGLVVGRRRRRARAG